MFYLKAVFFLSFSVLAFEEKVPDEYDRWIYYDSPDIGMSTKRTIYQLSEKDQKTYFKLRNHLNEIGLEHIPRIDILSAMFHFKNNYK